MGTTKNNKLIADFMGSLDEYNHHKKYSYEGAIDYSNSWSWLMPVVNKIISIKNNDFDLVIKFGNEDDFICLRTRNQCNKASAWSWDILVCEQNKGIETVYKVVIKFIKWYNKNKN